MRRELARPAWAQSTPEAVGDHKDSAHLRTVFMVRMAKSNMAKADMAKADKAGSKTHFPLVGTRFIASGAMENA